MAIQRPNKPSYQSALVQVNRIIAPEWLRWFNEIQASSAAVTDLEAQLAALAALVATDQANIATLQAQMLAVQTAQAAAEAAIAALQTAVTNLQSTQNLHTLQITNLQAAVEALETYHTVFATRTVTADTSIVYADFDVDCDATGGAITVTLPPAARLVLGEYHVVSKIDATLNTVTIDGNGQTIDDAATAVLLLPGWSVDLQWNGTIWKLH
jgi:multidrug efflux pump subunit AcrA (membrane-fusion protein)